MGRNRILQSGLDGGSYKIMDIQYGDSDYQFLNEILTSENVSINLNNTGEC